MIKKIFILFAFLLTLTTSAIADEHRRIKLDDDKNSRKVVEVANLSIFVELTDLWNDGNAKVRIDLENIDESKGLSLFERAYSEKTLKKSRPKIIYDKIFPGSKGKRFIEACGSITHAMHLRPSQKETLMAFLTTEGKVTKITLPIYVVEYKHTNPRKKQQYILLQKEVVVLEIEIDLHPGEEYDIIKKECDQLLKDLQDVSFCPNKMHQPSLEEQKAESQKRIDSLLAKINGIIEANGWFSSDRKYKLYNEQAERLRKINLEEKHVDCGKHVVVHKCKYCNLSLQQISHKFDDIYQTIYSSSDRKSSKLAHIRSVNSMYDCAKRRKDWARSSYKSKIERLYKDINRF